MNRSNDGDYVPQAGDKYVLGLYPGGRWLVKAYDGGEWLTLTIAHSEDEVAAQVAGMAQVGTSRNGRKYYRKPEEQSLNLQWAREALEQNGTPVTPANLVTITGQQVNEWQARVWLASQAEDSRETEEGNQ